MPAWLGMERTEKKRKKKPLFVGGAKKVAGGGVGVTTTEEKDTKATIHQEKERFRTVEIQRKSPGVV